MKKRTMPGLFDEENRLTKISNHGDPLEKIKQMLEWEQFRPIIESSYEKYPQEIGGRPRLDSVMMFKTLVIQRYYNISDEQMEYQILDRLSFMRFLGLSIKDNVPDQNSIWLFREHLTRNGLVKKLFDRFQKMLDAEGIIANRGSIVDASFVEVPRQRNKRKENQQIQEGIVPEGWKKNPDKLRQKDLDARWATKNEEKHYGYKNHIKIDKKSKIITKYEITDAAMHDSQALDKLLDKKNSHHELYGDSAYSGKPIKNMLDKKKIKSRIHEKGYRDAPLNEEQKIRNRKKSKIRARVEHIYGFIENSMKGSFIRVIGKIRASSVIGLMNLTYDMFRYVQLTRA